MDIPFDDSTNAWENDDFVSDEKLAREAQYRERELRNQRYYQSHRGAHVTWVDWSYDEHFLIFGLIMHLFMPSYLFWSAALFSLWHVLCSFLSNKTVRVPQSTHNCTHNFEILEYKTILLETKIEGVTFLIETSKTYEKFRYNELIHTNVLSHLAFTSRKWRVQNLSTTTSSLSYSGPYPISRRRTLYHRWRYSLSGVRRSRILLWAHGWRLWIAATTHNRDTFLLRRAKVVIMWLTLLKPSLEVAMITKAATQNAAK